MKKYYSLKEMINKTGISLEIIKHNIEKYTHLVLVNSEWNSKILISTSNISSVDVRDNAVYIITKDKIHIDGMNKDVDEFEIDLIDDNSDILGFTRIDYVFEKFNKKEINNADFLLYKLIFSPVIGNWLLSHGYTIKELKKRDNSEEIIYVFVIEDGFFECIKDFKNNGRK